MVLPPNGNYCPSCGILRNPPRPPKTTLQNLRPFFRPVSTPDRSLKPRSSVLLSCAGVVLLACACILFGFFVTGISPFSLQSRKVPRRNEIANAQPKGTPLFADNFSSDAHGWNLQSSPGNYSVTLGNGVLSLQIEKHSVLWELLPGERTFSNFTLTVNADLSQGDQNDGYGVYVRGTSNQETDLATYYRFELYGDGSYAIFKGMTGYGDNSIATKMVDYTLNPAINKSGKVNQIMILAQGASLSFVVNGQLLKTVKDTSFSSGMIALFVSNLPEAKLGAQAQFSQFAIYPPKV